MDTHTQLGDIRQIAVSALKQAYSAAQYTPNERRLVWALSTIADVIDHDKRPDGSGDCVVADDDLWVSRIKPAAKYPRKNSGWILYPIPPMPNGNIVEDLDTICRLVGSICYEWRKTGGKFFIRRLD